MGMQMGKPWVRGGIILLLYAGLMVAACVHTGGIEAQILTNQGRSIKGNLTGIYPIVQLDPTDLTSNTLARRYEIPIAKVEQITVDFPRVIVETAERTYIGPFSAFHGISQQLAIQKEKKSTKLHTAALRAIVVDGTSIHPAPREWLNNGFLSVPELPISQVSKQGPTVLAEEPVRFELPLTQKVAPPPPESEGPPLWQIRLLIIGALFALYFTL
ncbi:MAG: hypothetical protein U9Q23_05300 [Candidatus Bipolaricaulota bacterium]|nr:hypothetical protein [Candidatus Bipolaricaulota bacterium]